MFWLNDADRFESMIESSAGRLGAHQIGGRADFSTFGARTAQSSYSTAAKYYDAFPADGVGGVKPISLNTALLLTPDTVGNDIGTTAKTMPEFPELWAEMLADNARVDG